jgi:hypothetical protein
MREKEPWKPVFSLPENELLLVVLKVPAASGLMQKGFEAWRSEPLSESGLIPVLIFRTDADGHLDWGSILIFFAPDTVTPRHILGMDRIRQFLEDKNALYPTEKPVSWWKRLWRVIFPSLTD